MQSKNEGISHQSKERGKTRAKFQEGDQWIQKEVDHEEQNEQFPELENVIPTRINETNESKADEKENDYESEEEQEEGLQYDAMSTRSVNNNVTRFDTSVERSEGELTDDEEQGGKCLSQFQVELIRDEDKQEILDEAVSRMEGRMERCMENLFNKAGFFQTAQKLQEQLQQGMNL